MSNSGCHDDANEVMIDESKVKTDQTVAGSKENMFNGYIQRYINVF